MYLLVLFRIFFIEVLLTFNVILVSEVQRNDSILVSVEKCSPRCLVDIGHLRIFFSCDKKF